MPASDAHVTPHAECHEPAARLAAARLARAAAAALAARRGGAPHGRAAADDPPAAAALARLVGLARRQRSRGCAGLSAGAAHGGRSPTRRCATASLTSRRRGGRRGAGARRPRRCCVRRRRAGERRTAVGQHDAARVADIRRRCCSVASRAGGRRLPDVLDPRPGHAARAAAAVRSARWAGRRRTRRSSTCTTSATCSSHAGFADPVMDQETADADLADRRRRCCANCARWAAMPTRRVRPGLRTPRWRERLLRATCRSCAMPTAASHSDFELVYGHALRPRREPAWRRSDHGAAGRHARRWCAGDRRTDRDRERAGARRPRRDAHGRARCGWRHAGSARIHRFSPPDPRDGDPARAAAA